MLLLKKSPHPPIPARLIRRGAKPGMKNCLETPDCHSERV